MFDISVKIPDLKRIERQYRFLGDQIPKWVAVGMTNTVRQGRADVQQAMPTYIDKPTPWTRRSVFFFPAEKEDLRAAVAFKWEFGPRPRREIGMLDAPQSMRMQAWGGGRKLKSFEKALQRAGVSPPGRPFVVPGMGADLDQYGNMRTGYINKVLYSGVRGGAASNAPLSGGGKSRSREAKAGIRYFAHPNKKGIYRTVPSSNIGGGRGRSGVVPVMLFVRQPHYSSRFPFDRIVSRAAAGLDTNVINALDRGTQRCLRS